MTGYQRNLHITVLRMMKIHLWRFLIYFSIVYGLFCLLFLYTFRSTDNKTTTTSLFPTGRVIDNDYQVSINVSHQMTKRYNESKNNKSFDIKVK